MHWPQGPLRHRTLLLPLHERAETVLEGFLMLQTHFYVFEWFTIIKQESLSTGEGRALGGSSFKEPVSPAQESILYLPASPLNSPPSTHTSTLQQPGISTPSPSTCCLFSLGLCISVEEPQQQMKPKKSKQVKLPMTFFLRFSFLSRP